MRTGGVRFRRQLSTPIEGEGAAAVYHPTTRVLTVLELLQARGRLSGPEIAERLEVDLRTVRRYVTMLQDLGIPVETERGRHGGYRLRPGFRLPPLLFTDDEALAATLGLMSARRLGLAAGPAAVEGALAKLERALPPDVRQRVVAVQQTLTIDAARPPDAPATSAVLALGAAAHQGRRVRIAYTNSQGISTERVVEPYGLVQFGRRWYLPAWCRLRGDRRLFRMDRIGTIELLDERFSPPADFDALAFVREALAAAPAFWTVVVRLGATLEEAQHRIAPHEATLAAGDGGVMMRFNIEDLDWAARYLVGLGFPFVVVAPDELRGVLRGIAAAVAAAAEA